MPSVVQYDTVKASNVLFGVCRQFRFVTLRSVSILSLLVEIQ